MKLVKAVFPDLWVGEVEELLAECLTGLRFQ
jgi:hypothetical protein